MAPVSGWFWIELSPQEFKNYVHLLRIILEYPCDGEIKKKNPNSLYGENSHPYVLGTYMNKYVQEV